MNHHTRLIGSIQRALDILELYNSRRVELGNAEIAHALGLPKSTIAGLVYTLEANGYLEQNPENRKYHLGFKLAERAGLLLSQFDLRQIALPHLIELRNLVNESVNLGVRDGSEVVYIERLLGTSMLGMRSEIGKRERIHSTALGKAMLACLNQNELQDFVGQYHFEPVTARTLCSPTAFLSDIENTRQRGYAIDDEENEAGGRCVAAAVSDFLGRPVAAVSISVPLQRLPAEKITSMGERVRLTAQAISRRLGAPLDAAASDELPHSILSEGA